MIKAIFSDIDGTLVSLQTHRIPQSTKDEIARVRAQGVKFFVATGREIHMVNNLEDLEVDGFITINGGLCFVNGKPIYRHVISDEDVKAMMDYQTNVRSFPLLIVQESGSTINFYDQNLREALDLINFPEIAYAPLEQMFAEPVYQLTGGFDKYEEVEIMKHLPGCETARWHPAFTDIIPKGSSKAVGIDKICEHFGFDISETLAIGDGGNDTPMLRHASIGIAVGGADDDVKAAADYVTDTVENDGYAKALRKFIP